MITSYAYKGKDANSNSEYLTVLAHNAPDESKKRVGNINNVYRVGKITNISTTNNLSNKLGSRDGKTREARTKLYEKEKPTDSN